RFSPDGSYVLSWEMEQASDVKSAPKILAVVRDPDTLAAKREYEAEPGAVSAISPDGQWLALGKDSGRWVLYDIPTGERIGEWEGHRDSVSTIAFVGPGRVLTGSADLTALLWDPRPKQEPTKPPW